MKKEKNKKPILVAEDNPGIAELIQIILEKAGYEVVVHHDGSSVLKAVATHKPALVLMDLWLPGTTGSALTIKLKQNPKTRSIPVVIISAQNRLKTIVKQTGADGFLGKPFDIEELLAVAAKYVVAA